MKHYLYSIIALVFGTSDTNAQTIKSVEDPHIVAQEKRQVFQQWGDWKPEGKTIFGINLNYHHFMVWGWGAPARNRRYKRGDDIRPLSLTGLQNQRYVTTLVQEDDAKKIHNDVGSVYDETLNEYYHNSALTLNTDPLYYLYYKDMLRQLEGFNTDWNKGHSWGFTRGESFKYWQKKGMLAETASKIEILKEKYKLAKNADMPRGKRIMQCHDVLKEWRRIQNYIKYLDKRAIRTIRNEEKLANLEKHKKMGGITKERKDAEIFVDVMMRHPYDIY